MIRVALIGNPNVGKTELFNRLTGLRQHVGNWPGVTVEKKVGKCMYKGVELEIVDLPGTYSLTAHSMAGYSLVLGIVYLVFGLIEVFGGTGETIPGDVF